MDDREVPEGVVTRRALDQMGDRPMSVLTPRPLAALFALAALLAMGGSGPARAQMPGEQPGGGGQMPGGPASPAGGDVVTTPSPGTPLRGAILDALRSAVIAEVGAPVEFVVGTLRVLGEWAFVEARPQRPGGGQIFYVYTRYQSAVDAGAFDDTVTALLRQTPAGWLVYEYSLGATDVVWLEWVDRNLAPAEVYPQP